METLKRRRVDLKRQCQQAAKEQRLLAAKRQRLLKAGLLCHCLLQSLTVSYSGLSLFQFFCHWVCDVTLSICRRLKA